MWDGPWAGDTNLKAKFSRLFTLSCNKEGRIAEMGRWFDGNWIWEFRWRRDLFDREKEVVEEMFAFLQNFKPTEGAADSWVWKGDKSGLFSVKTAYNRIAALSPETEVRRGQRGWFGRIWKTLAPTKAQTMAWRLIWNRLPSCDLLSNKISLSAEELKCKCCEVTEENIADVWTRLVWWVGVSWGAPDSVENHFLAFSGLLPGKKWTRGLGSLWVCAVSVTWKWRNKVVFEKIPWDFRRLEEEIKCRFWSWYVVKGVTSQDCYYNN